MRKLFLTAATPGLILLVLTGTFAGAQTRTSPPQVPAAIQAPAGTEVALLAHASGWQIYTCQAAADGKFSWALKAPDANLHNENGQRIGHHSAGPTWTLKDGSAVVGKAAAKVDSPDANSVAWLLVNVVSHSGKGQLDNVTAIQRVNTHNGKPPAGGCDAAHSGAQNKSAYTADYYFYVPASAR